jgi:hypothetical protein
MAVAKQGGMGMFSNWSLSKKTWTILAVIGVIALIVAIASANQCGAETVVGGP